MGSQFVDGSAGWGSILGNVVSGLESAPGKALSNIHAAETIKDQRIKRAREEEDYQLRRAGAGLLDAAVPAAQAAPTTAVGPFVGDINDPAVTAGLPKASFIDPREQAAAEARRAYLVATGKADTLAKPGQGPAALSYATVGATGVPTDAPKRAELEFYATGKFPTHIGADDSKNPIKQWVPVNDKNEPIGQAVASRVSPGPSYVLANPISLNQRDDTKVTMKNWVEIDPTTKQPTGNRTTAADPPPGGNWLLGGVADATAANPYKDAASARDGLARIENERIANGGLRTPVQAMEAARLFEVAYPRSRVEVEEGGRKVTKSVRAEPIPDWLRQLHKLSDDVAQGRHTAPEGTATAPYVDPNSETIVSRAPPNPAALRKEYADQPEIAAYGNAAQTWNAAVESAYTGNKARDLAIVYGFIKMLDSITGVRDAEVKMVGQVGSWPEQVQTMIGQATGEGLNPTTRVNILETMKNHLDQFKAGAENKKEFFTQVATDSGLAPNAVIPPLLPLSEFDRNRALAVRDPTAAAPTAPPPRRGADAVIGR